MINDDEFRELIHHALTKGIPLPFESDVVILTHEIWEIINTEATDIHSDHFQHFGLASVIYIENRKDKRILQINVGPDRIIFMVVEEILEEMKNSKQMRRDIGWAALHTIRGFGEYMSKHHPDIAEKMKK